MRETDKQTNRPRQRTKQTQRKSDRLRGRGGGGEVDGGRVKMVCACYCL